MSEAINYTLNDKYLRIFCIPISNFSVLLVQMPYFFPGDWPFFWKSVTISIIFNSLMWEIARVIILRMRHRYSTLGQTSQRAGWTFFLLLVQYAIGQALITEVFFVLNLRVDKSFTFFQNWLLYFSCTLFFIIVVSSIYEAKYFFSQYKSTVYKAESLKRNQAQQRLDALKTRVNPHFLFNALTTLSALIGEDAPRAERFVDELSKVYRYLLRAGRQPIVTLREELQFADSYVFLLQNRFEVGVFSFIDNCRGNTKSPRQYELLDHTLSALVFQNALDYFVRTQNLPLHIHTDIHENELLIAGNYQPKNRSIDVSDHDWAQLEHLGVRKALMSDQLTMFIPLTSNTLIS